jgi:hypothetical protein
VSLYSKARHENRQKQQSMTTFTLKTYQQSALSALTLFLRQASTVGLEAAWAHAMGREGGSHAMTQP